MTTADHTRLVNECRKELNRLGILNWNNQTSGAWAGQVVYQKDGEVLLRNARPFQAGLCTGSSDIIAVLPDGRFCAIECKTGKGRTTKEQRIFIEAINKKGGVGMVVRSVDELCYSLTNKK